MKIITCPFCGELPEVTQNPGNEGKDYKCRYHTQSMTLEEWNNRCKESNNE